jgi:hypothetical protein
MCFITGRRKPAGAFFPAILVPWLFPSPRTTVRARRANLHNHNPTQSSRALLDRHTSPLTPSTNPKRRKTRTRGVTNENSPAAPVRWIVDCITKTSMLKEVKALNGYISLKVSSI